MRHCVAVPDIFAGCSLDPSCRCNMSIVEGPQWHVQRVAWKVGVVLSCFVFCYCACQAWLNADWVVSVGGFGTMPQVIRSKRKSWSTLIWQLMRMCCEGWSKLGACIAKFCLSCVLSINCTDLKMKESRQQQVVQQLVVSSERFGLASPEVAISSRGCCA